MPAPLPVCPEGIGQTRINGKRKPRGFRLRIADSSVDNTSPHQQREVLARRGRDYARRLATLAPTSHAHLGLTPIPPDMRGAQSHTVGQLHAAELR